jgi:hypothetical protein
MGESPFTEAQNAYIDSFMDALTAKLDAGTDSHELTKWKQTTASEIQNSPLFTTLDLAVHNKQQWFQVRTVVWLSGARTSLTLIPDYCSEIHQLSQ